MAIYTPSSDSQGESRRMRLIYFSNEFPHDDLQTLLRRLHRHSKDKKHPLLANFIDKATSVLREEVQRLPTESRELIPAFESVFDFADHPDLRTGPLCGSIDGVLLCLVEIGAFIGYCEEFPKSVDFTFSNTYLAGLGIGLLASAAVSLAPTVADIARYGAEVVRVAFRLGVVVADVSQNLEPRDPSNSPDSWAYVIPDVDAEDVQKELDAIQERDQPPASSQIFLSAYSSTSVTISGPPSRLKTLFRTSGFFRDRKFISLPVFGGLCHASHIYNQNHVQDVLETCSTELLDCPLKSDIPIFAPSMGRPFSANDARDLFEQIITEILTQAIRWDSVIDGLVQRADRIAASECQLLVFRKSLPIHDLVAAMKKAPQPVEASTEEIIPWISSNVSDQEEPRGPMQSKIAIVGMSCRLPGGATDTEKFWKILEDGLDVHRKIPADRFDVETHCDTTGKKLNASQTEYGCFIDEPGLFDAPFFNMSPREANQTCPMQRLILVTAYEALERSGFVPNRTASTRLHRVGTFFGQASDDYREVNAGQEVGTYYIPGGCRAFGPGRINYFFKFSGPSFNIDTACSSSLAAIQAACTSLWAGDADTVVTGGTNVLTNCDGFAGLSNGHFLSKTPNACKTWDENADGYVRADAVGSLVMKRYEDAVADNDNILGVVLSGATNHSAEAVSITHPHAGAQSYLYRSVANRAGRDPLDVSYVEMHGTGTQAGDMTEIKSVTDVFAPAKKKRNSKQPLHIGAVKSNVGHSESAAGVTALIKVLLMLQKEAIPPHVGIKTALNPGFPKDLESRNVHVPYKKTSWPHVDGQKRLAVVNNFSAAGGNTTLLLEEGPGKVLEDIDSRSAYTVALSAKSKGSLKGNIERFLAYLDENPEIALRDLSYTTTARKYHHNHRLAVSGSEMPQIKKQLASALETVETTKPIPTTGPPSITFAFTGQGSALKSSNYKLFHDSPYFKSQMLNLDALAQGQGFPSFIPAIDGSFPKEHEHSPVITQLALSCTEVALAKYWGSLGVKPSAVIGHSLGEYAALHVAGVLSASDMIFLVGARAQLLEQKCPKGYKMMAVKASVGDIEKSAGDKPYQVACMNGAKDTTLSGTAEQIDALCKVLQAENLKCTVLDVAFAFHSDQTDPVLDDFEKLAKSGVEFHTPELPVISPLLGKVIFDGKTVNANYMRRATREPVNFVAALDIGQKFTTINEKTVWIEIGPHPVCMSFVKATMPAVNVAVPSMRRDEDNWKTIAQSAGALHCAGVDIDWNEFHRPFESALQLLDLPTYAWNDKTYWLQYNGDWVLTKGNTFYDKEKAVAAAKALPAVNSELNTSTVHGLIEESFNGTAGKIVMQSDLMHPDFFAAAWGHKMNNCGVVTSSIHADIAWTLGKHLHEKLKPSVKTVNMNMANLQVSKGLVAKKKGSSPQQIRVAAETEDINGGMVDLKWYNVSSEGAAEDEPFATAQLYYENATEWLDTWIPYTHLVQGRIQDLEHLAEQGIANRFSHKMAYNLFGNKLVDYADKYRGMQSVVMHQLEAFADVTLSTEKSGTWTVPPFFIDSVAHLAGFVMNVSDAMDTNANFCVTPGWRSMRFAKPLVAGAKYRSYVKMIPTADDPTVYLGDVYIFQNDEIIGMVGGIQFRQYPRVLLNRFFSAPEDNSAKGASAAPAKAVATTSQPAAKAPSAPAKTAPTAPAAEPAPAPETVKEPAAAPAPAPEKKPEPAADAAAPAATGSSVNPESTTGKALAIVARESALELSDLTQEACFENLGIDSLLSLVISEKFRDELQVTISGGLFLEYPTVGDLTAWLQEYYD